MRFEKRKLAAFQNCHKIRTNGSKLIRFAVMHSKMNCSLNDANIELNSLLGIKKRHCNSKQHPVGGYLCFSVELIQVFTFKIETLQHV